MSCLYRHSYLTHISQPAHALSDSTIHLSAKKAAELQLNQGDVVVVIGRRRHASYATVSIAGKAKGICGISANLAANLRLRQDDKLKVEPLHTETDDERSGDLELIQQTPKNIVSVTFSPVEDSLEHLVKLEGGDSLPDDELQARFVAPYLENQENALLKQNHLLTLTDDNGHQLEWYVSNVELEGAESEEDSAAVEDGTCRLSMLTVISHTHISISLINSLYVCRRIRSTRGRRVPSLHRSSDWRRHTAHPSRLGVRQCGRPGQTHSAHARID